MSYSINVPKDVNILASYGAEPRKFKAGVHHDVPPEYALHPYAVANGVKVLTPEAPAGAGEPLISAEAETAIAAQANIDAGAPADSDQEPETAEEIAKDAVLAAKGETKEMLLAQADELGLKVDKRWGLAKLQAAIDAALAA
jgi:hypothetical protein